jgi:predicted molibdopterin-dependent oxidoreductase YjgC
MAEIIKLKIDEVEVAVERGKTILEAAQSAGIRIPTLCYDPRLIPFGACRLCVIQEKGKLELLPSCFTPVREGMEIITSSLEIIESRRLQLQLILLNHPMICPRCEKEGECNLQTLVYEYGVEETIYPWERVSFPVDDSSPLLQRDPNRCILCGRCVRICDEVQGIGELSFAKRGTRTVIDTDFHRPLQCEFCGQCMDTCPVGAITSDRFDYKTKAWELRETTTPCPYCGCGCLLTIGSKEGEVKRVFSDLERGPNGENLCVKGRFGWDFVDHPERVKTPLLRVNGIFKEATWEEALSFTVKQLEAIKDQYGPESITAMASGRLTNEEIYLFQRLFKNGIGTHQIDFDHAGGRIAEGLRKTLGYAASTNSIQEIRSADCLLVIGVDPAHANPIIKNEIHLAIRRNRAQLIVLGNYDIGLTQATEISPLSPSSIPLLGRPGIEVSMVNAMIQTILKENLEDREFVEEKTEGIEELKERMSVLKPPEERKGNIEKAARIFAQAKRAMILIGSGSWSHLEQEEIAIASSNLALITGHVGKESSGILILLEKCNSQGIIDVGASNKGNGREGLFQRIHEGKLKALYLVGKNLLVSSSAQWSPALEKLQLLIVQDLFMTETAKMAHVILPACAFIEKEGTFTNLERRVQKLNSLRPPFGKSKSDFEIFLQLLALLESTVPGDTSEGVFDEIRRHIPHYQDIQDGEQWPKGSSFLYSKGFPIGKAKLIPVEGERSLSNPEGYPFQLVQRPSLFQSGQLSSRSDSLKKVSEKPHLAMNPEDAQRLKIEDGEFVQIVNPKGQSLKMNVTYSRGTVPSVITAPYPCPIIEEGRVASIKVERLKRT